MVTNPKHDFCDRHPVLYQAALSQAAQAGESMMAKVLAHTRLSLQECVKKARGLAERDQAELALKLLDSHQRGLCEQYSPALKSVFNQTSSDAMPEGGGLARPHFDQLDLMDSEQVQESVVLARAQQAAMLVIEGALAELNTYICATLGLKFVQPEKNLLRPEIFLQALQSVLLQTQVLPAVRMSWLSHMGLPLGQELSTLYASLSAQLASKGIKPAGYAVLQAKAAHLQTNGSKVLLDSDRRSPERNRSAAAPGSSVLTLDHLRKLLAGELDYDAVDAVPAGSQQNASRKMASSTGAAQTGEQMSRSFVATVPAAMQALSEMKQVEQLIERLVDREVKGGSKVVDQEDAMQAVRDHFRRVASGAGQALGLEVVSLMVENIAQDSRLLEPVKELIRRLEPALLRLALVDPRFFIDKQHPARRLLEEITHRSFAYETEDAPGFSQFLAVVTQVVAPLAARAIPDAQPFEEALSGLLSLWDEGKSASQFLPAMKALQEVEARHLLAEKMAADIRARPSAERVPVSVLDFACGPWAQVMAHARLTDTTGDDDPGSYRELLLALFWSAQPELARKNVGKLTKLIPRLLGKLREGLDSIGYPARKASAFFELLMKLHQQAFKQVADASNDVPAPEARASSLVQLDAWVVPAEAKVSGFMSMPDEDTTSSSDAGQPVVDMLAAQDAVAEPVAHGALDVGSWVELRINGVWVRTQLTWASPHGSLFLFTCADGSTQSMTRRSRDKLLSIGNMRVVSEQPLVDAALDAVVQTAMLNSIDIKP